MRSLLSRFAMLSAVVLAGSVAWAEPVSPASPPASPPSPASPSASPASPPAVKKPDAKAAEAKPAMPADAAKTPDDAKAADPKPPAATGGTGLLADKGLAKTGPMYTLHADKDLADAMKAIAVARSKMGEENKNRAVVEKEIKRARAVYSQLDFEKRGLLTKLQGVKDATQNNQIVAKLETIDSQLKEADQYKEEKEKELGKIGEDNKTKYANLILDTGAAGDKAEKDYAELAADADVKKALEDAKAKLGPSPEFVANMAALKRLRATVSSETIEVKMESGVPMVQVTLNKSFTREMVFDSGSSTIAIPASLAKQMELVPAATDPIVHLVLADGRKVEARQTTLKSVRVGSFTVENVECAILPAELVAAEPLLGGSFLEHFVYKLDSKAGQLHLAQVGTGAPAAGAAKPK